MQTFARLDPFTAASRLRALESRPAWLGQGCAIPKGSTAPTGTAQPLPGAMAPVAPPGATADEGLPGWVLPTGIGVGAAAALGVGLWALGVL